MVAKMTKEELDLEIREYLRSGGKLFLVEGIFSGGAYVKVPTIVDGSPEYEIMGCSYRWKFNTDRNLIDSIATTKRLFMEILKLFASFPPSILFYKKISKIFFSVYMADLEGKFPRHLPQPLKELWRVAQDKPYSRLAKCLITFLFDSAYCFRLQDLFSEMDMGNIRKDARREIVRLLDVLLSREVSFLRESVFSKVKKIKWLVSAALLIPSIKNGVADFLLSLSVDKIRLSESDAYFCLDRIDYNYMGLTHEDRLEIKKTIDRAKGNIMLAV